MISVISIILISAQIALDFSTVLLENSWEKIEEKEFGEEELKEKSESEKHPFRYSNHDGGSTAAFIAENFGDLYYRILFQNLHLPNHPANASAVSLIILLCCPKMGDC